ncbi:hypothetical protein [Deinococcus hopiensis]|uniref:hypothetical protein n=1 Tax=Deinococcus hopiensis TaxID=309885 RepID=UPI00111BDE90|nr:hypothetical protein [Deinococcus hopiensis]
MQTVFSTADLMNNKVVKVVASSEYQISIVFPRKVQSVGVNAAKQSALMATIDQYDGMVVYLDVIRQGGTANLNVRLLTPADEAPKPGGGSRDPVILKLLVDLTKKPSGVLAYTIRDATPAPKPAPVPARRSVVVTASKPAPVKAAPKPVVAKPAVVKPVAMKPVAAKPAPILATTPKPAPVKPAAPKPAPRAKPTTFYGSNDGLKVEARVDSTAGDMVTVNYTISQTQAKDRTLYLFDNQAVNLRIRDDVSSASLERGQPRMAPLSTSAPMTGSIRIPRSEINKKGAKILMFALQEKDTGTNHLGQKRFLGVMLK